MKAASTETTSPSSRVVSVMLWAASTVPITGMEMECVSLAKLAISTVGITAAGRFFLGFRGCFDHAERPNRRDQQDDCRDEHLQAAAAQVY